MFGGGGGGRRLFGLSPLEVLGGTAASSELHRGIDSSPHGISLSRPTYCRLSLPTQPRDL